MANGLATFSPASRDGGCGLVIFVLRSAPWFMLKTLLLCGARVRLDVTGTSTQRSALQPRG
jgi:hypothetical protein